MLLGRSTRGNRYAGPALSAATTPRKEGGLGVLDPVAISFSIKTKWINYLSLPPKASTPEWLSEYDGSIAQILCSWDHLDPFKKVCPPPWKNKYIYDLALQLNKPVTVLQSKGLSLFKNIMKAHNLEINRQGALWLLTQNASSVNLGIPSSSLHSQNVSVMQTIHGMGT